MLRNPIAKLGIVLFLAGFVSTNAFGQLPAARLDGVFPFGGKAGSTVVVKVAGKDLEKASQLLFSHANITAKPTMAPPGPFDDGPVVVENSFDVQIPADVPVGFYDLRVVSKYGVSNPRVFEVADREIAIEEEPTDPAKEIPVVAIPFAVMGKLDQAADVDQFPVQLKAGQRTLVSCKSKILDSRMVPKLLVRGRDFGFEAKGLFQLNGDAVLDFIAPRDGTYDVTLADELYGGGPEYFYGVTIQQTPFVDFVFPPFGQAGVRSKHTIYGRNLPGGKPASVSLNGMQLDVVETEIDFPAQVTSEQAVRFRLSPEQTTVDLFPWSFSGANPILLGVAKQPVTVEAANNDRPDQPQVLQLGTEISGQFYPKRDDDWFQFEAKKGDIVVFSVVSSRFGLPTDPILMIHEATKDEMGVEKLNLVATADDFENKDAAPEFHIACTDPEVRFEVPRDGIYKVLLRDNLSSVKSDPRLVYRLSFRGQTEGFRLVAVPEESYHGLELRRGSREAIQVLAIREPGYQGEIKVTAEGMPAGVTAQEITIGPARNSGSVVLTVAADAPAGIANLKIRGKGTINGQEVLKEALIGTAVATVQVRQPNSNLPSVPARVSRSLAAYVPDLPAVPVTLALAADQVIETSRSGIVKIPYTVTKEEGFAGTIQGFTLDMPLNIQAQQFNVDVGKGSGEIEIRLQTNSPTGTYTGRIAGFVQNYRFTPDPEVVTVAEARKAKIDQLFKESDDAKKLATTEKQKADQALQTATTELSQANTAKTQADTASQNANKEMVAGEAKVKQAKEALAANPNDVALQNNVKVAEQELTALVTKAQTAKTAADEAAKKQDDAQTKQTAANDAKVAADKALEVANERYNLLQRTKTETDQKTNQVKQANQPRGINFNVSSNSFTIKVAESPITLTLPANVLQLKQNEQIEIPIQVQRLYGFNGPVNFTFQIPGGVNGLQPTNGMVTPEQTEAKLILKANPNATPGVHKIGIRSSLNFNGQGLNVDREVQVEIIKVEAKQ